MSPFLFIICSEVLSSLLKFNEVNDNLKGVGICKDAPEISHLFFADDSLLFIKAEKKEAENLMLTLLHYEKASGQKINIEKSSCFFSHNVTNEAKVDIMNVLKMNPMNVKGKYLGLPILILNAPLLTVLEIKLLILLLNWPLTFPRKPFGWRKFLQL